MQKLASPKVSILITTYNRAELLRRAINSVLSQTFADWEIIIWDDGSSDHTRIVVESYNDSRIRYFFSKNHGKSHALNQALKMARGYYLAILDDDDEWFPEKLDFQVTVMRTHPEIDLLFTNFYNVNADISRIGIGFERYKIVFSNLSVEKILQDTYLVLSGIPEQLVKANIILPSSILMKRSCFEIAGDFREGLHNGEDLEYWWRLAMFNANFAYTDRILLNRFRQVKSLSGQHSNAYKNHIRALQYCRETALTHKRGDLISGIDRAIFYAWLYLIRINILRSKKKIFKGWDNEDIR